MRRATRRFSYARAHATALVLYLMLAIVLTLPVLLNLTTHVPGDGRDDPPLVWNLWWVLYALLDQGTNPLVCNYLFYPLGVNLTYYTLTILNALTTLPFQLLGGLALASNLHLYFAYTIAGFGAYLLALDVLAATQRRNSAMLVAAFVAGCIYAFAPVKMIFASLGQYNMTSTHWLPLCVLYLIRLARAEALPAAALGAAGPGVWGIFRAWLQRDRRGLRYALLAALFLLFTAYAEFTFASFLGIFLVVYLAYLWVNRRASWNAWLIGRLLVLGGAFGAGLWPILNSMLSEVAREGDYTLAAGWGFADVFAADLLGFFVPSHLHPVLGKLGEQVTASFSYTNFATAGLAALALAVIGLRWRRASAQSHRLPVSFWGWSALLYAVLSLGPVLHIAGRWVHNLDGLLVRIPLPFIILHYIPLIKANRYPSRLQVLVVLCLAVLAAYGVMVVLNRTRIFADKAGISADRDTGQRTRTGPRAILAVVIVGAVLFEYLAVPLPLSDMRTPAVYARIAQENDGAPVLQLPVSWRNSFQFIPQSFTQLPREVNTVVMFQQYYQTTHKGPIVSGNTSRNPEFTFTYFLEAPIIRSLVALEEGRTLSPEQVAYDRSLMPEALRFFGFHYVVLHPPLVGGPVEEYVRAVFPVEPMPADPGLAAYRIVAPPPVERLEIDMAGDLSRLYRAEGWGEPQAIGGRAARWTDRPQARLLLPLAEASDVTLTLDVFMPAYNTGLDILVNGRRLPWYTAGVPIRGEWTSLVVPVPRQATRPGLNDITIGVPDGKGFRTAGSFADVGATPVRVGQTDVRSKANIVIHSAGLDAGGDLGFAHIYVNGKDVIKGQRGLNVAVIDPGSGNVQQTARFDFAADTTAGARLLDFTKGIADGQIVALAVMDDASHHFDANAAQALRLIGAQADLTGRLRNSYAAIGVKGAAAGTALEQWQQGRPASVTVGAHVFGKGLGVAVSGIAVEQQ